VRGAAVCGPDAGFVLWWIVCPDGPERARGAGWTRGDSSRTYPDFNTSRPDTASKIRADGADFCRNDDDAK